MDLREYLFRNRLSITDFAKKINYDRNYISKIMHSVRSPGQKLAKEIEKATNGEVKANDLIKEKEA